MHILEDYHEIIGDELICTIHKKARSFYGKHILHINSTYQGGSGAEILGSFFQLTNNIGSDTGMPILVK